MIFWTIWFQPIESPTIFFNKTKTILGLNILLYWSHLNVFYSFSIASWYTKVEFWKQIISHWSCSNNSSLCMSWWFIKLLLDAKYLPPKSHYMASHQVCSMKTLHHTGHIYMAYSPLCILWWFTKSTLREIVLSHWLHSNGFSPVCMFWWLIIQDLITIPMKHPFFH